ncbi:hypothetical protein SDC9_85957 [bioreactor metagenome]|uniref:Uncharacterized protein n=1 Tax=bioreactor metagenome TaxID=1076179 RepID=A0A644ZNN2_9ZZZZ
MILANVCPIPIETLRVMEGLTMFASYLHIV